MKEEQTKSQFVDNQKGYAHPATGRWHVESINNEPTKTQQQFAEECDVNYIMAKYEKTGEFLHLQKGTPIQGDFTELGDYQSMIEKINAASDNFMSLPAKVRLRFQNNPGNLIDFLSDQENYDEGVKLGLINPKAPDEKQIQQTQIKQTQTQSKTKTQKPIQEANDEGTD